jgi:hypothetical protein
MYVAAVLVVLAGIGLLLSAYSVHFVCHPVRSLRYDMMPASIQRIWLLELLLIALGFSALYCESLF